MSVEENKATVRRFFDGWNKSDLADMAASMTFT